MKCPAFITAFVLPLALAGALRAADPGPALLDRVIQFPGSYGQVCDVMTAPPELPYRAYQLSGFAGASFSKANLATMQANRAELVKAIRARLLEIDLKQKAASSPRDPAPEESNDGDDVGCDPKVLNPLLLDLILELDAVEALPELLALEAKLVKGIAAAKNDAKSPPPAVGGWHVAEMVDVSPVGETEAKRDRRIQLFQSRVAQRDLVMLMGRLLRGKNYAPYMTTALEKAYVKGIKAQAKELGISDYKPGDKLTGEQEYLQGEIKIDVPSKVPVAPYTSVDIPYSRESRDEVRTVAAKWIEEHR